MFNNNKQWRGVEHLLFKQTDRRSPTHFYQIIFYIYSAATICLTHEALQSSCSFCAAAPPPESSLAAVSNYIRYCLQLRPKGIEEQITKVTSQPQFNTLDVLLSYVLLALTNKVCVQDNWQLIVKQAARICFVVLAVEVLENVLWVSATAPFSRTEPAFNIQQWFIIWVCNNSLTRLQ